MASPPPMPPPSFCLFTSTPPSSPYLHFWDCLQPHFSLHTLPSHLLPHCTLPPKHVTLRLPGSSAYPSATFPLLYLPLLLHLSPCLSGTWHCMAGSPTAGKGEEKGFLKKKKRKRTCHTLPWCLPYHGIVLQPPPLGGDQRFCDIIPLRTGRHTVARTQAGDAGDARLPCPHTTHTRSFSLATTFRRGTPVSSALPTAYAVCAFLRTTAHYHTPHASLPTLDGRGLLFYGNATRRFARALCCHFTTLGVAHMDMGLYAGAFCGGSGRRVLAPGSRHRRQGGPTLHCQQPPPHLPADCSTGESAHRAPPAPQFEEGRAGRRQRAGAGGNLSLPLGMGRCSFFSACGLG